MSSILSIAPMIQWTDVHWRYFMRQITSETLLYTEMIMDNAIIYNPTKLQDFLGPPDFQGPLAVQLGGSDPNKLAQAASMCEGYARFKEINLNCGCPSQKAKKTGFGAELMLEPELVTRIMYEMNRQVTNTDLSVKCRLGVTGRDSYEELVDFIHGIESVGIRKVIIHARKCILHGLSPAQNRNIPPLHYHWVYQLIKDFPTMKFTLNGGIEDFEDVDRKFQDAEEFIRDKCKSDEDSNNDNHKEKDDTFYDPHLSGVMMGRAAYKRPWTFADADRRFFHRSNQEYTRREVLERYLDYCIDVQNQDIYGNGTCNLLKPLHYFFHGYGQSTTKYKHRLNELTKKYAKEDNILSPENGVLSHNIMDIVMEAIEDIPKECLDGNGLERCEDGVGMESG